MCSGYASLRFAFLLLKALQEATTAANQLLEGKWAGWRERGSSVGPFISITDLPNVTNSQPPTPTLLSHPHLPISLPLPPLASPPVSCSSPSPPRGDQLTATSWGGPGASCPCPGALLASGPDRTDRDTVIGSHSTPVLTHRGVRHTHRPASKNTRAKLES